MGRSWRSRNVPDCDSDAESASEVFVVSVLYIVVCAAGPARDVHVLINIAKQRGYDTCLIATPAAYEWLDIPKLIEETGHPVRKQHRMPGEPDVLPKPAAFIVAPATFNTINKLASGITDNLALGLLNENIGLRTPIVILPYLNSAYAKHPAFAPSVDRLHSAGVTVLLDVHGPREGDPSSFPWASAIDALERMNSPAGPG